MKTERECPACAGQGEIDHNPFSVIGDYRKCPECGGEGWLMYGKDILPCRECGGEGKE